MKCKRDPNLSLNEHVDHVLKIITELEVEYDFSPSQKKHFLLLSLTHEAKILEHIREFVLLPLKSWMTFSFDELPNFFKEH